MRAPILICLVILLLAFAAPVLAQSEEIPTFDKALILASGPLVAAIVAVILSWVVEWFPQYEALAPRVKRLSFAAACLLVPVLAATLRGALGFVPWSFDPLYWHALWYGAAAYGVGNLAHTRKLPNG